MSDVRDFGLRGVIIVAINGIYMIVAALVCWLMGRTAFIGPMLLGFVALWAAMIALTAALGVFTRYNRQFNLYDRAYSYLGTNLVVSAVPLVLFAAYMAAQAHQVAMGASWAERLAIYCVGFFASYVAHSIVTLFFEGQLYALINLFIALIGYVLLVLARTYL